MAHISPIKIYMRSFMADIYDLCVSSPQRDGTIKRKIKNGTDRKSDIMFTEKYYLCKNILI
jgi:hypothetical protein